MKERERRPFFFGWWVVGVSVIGISASPAPMVLASFGLFMKQFSAEFGWSRSEISICMTVMTIALASCLPLVGRLLDRFGTRRVLLPSMLALTLCLAAIPLFADKLWHVVLLYGLIGSLSAGSNSVTYMHLLAAWFDKFRGLALGIGMSGMGLGFIYVPLLVQFMIDHGGWRAAFYTLSATVLCIAMPLAWWGVKDTPQALGLNPDGSGSGASPKSASKDVGMNLSEVLRRREFWMLVAIFLMTAFVLNGLIAHLAPMLTDRGMHNNTAALAASTVGAAVFAGRILIGYLIDRFFAPHVAIFFFSLSALGVAVLGLGAAGPMAFVAAITIGLSFGAELDLLAYLASRYFGLRALGSVCGILLASILVGTAISPVAFALWFESAGSYIGALGFSVILNAVAVLITALLGPYPDWEQAQSTTN